jgi:phosphate transport system substrate-binding protein
MNKILIPFFLTFFFLGIVANFAVSGESLEIWGSTTCQKRFLEPGAKDAEKATGVSIRVNGTGTGQGLVALITGKTEVSAASEDLNDAIASAKNYAQKTGIPLTVPKTLKFHKILDDEIVPIIHKSNPVKSLSWQQLKAIHTGSIKNWKEVGGPDLPITVVTSHEGSATRAFFSKTVMGNEPYVSTSIKVDSTAKEILETSKNQGAIGVVSIAFLMITHLDTKILNTDKMVRPLGLITIGAPSAKAKKVIDYFQSEEGKKSIGKIKMF